MAEGVRKILQRRIQELRDSVGQVGSGKQNTLTRSEIEELRENEMALRQEQSKIMGTN